MDLKQKEARLARAVSHAEQDRLISGRYMNKSHQGCSVGCDLIDIQLANGVPFEDITDYDCHALVADHDGTPEWLELLRDSVFEGLPKEKRSWWHVGAGKVSPCMFAIGNPISIKSALESFDDLY